MPTTPRYPSLPHYRSRLIPRGRISTNGVSRPVTLPNASSQHYSRLSSARSRSKTPILLQLEVQSDQVQQAAPQKRAAKVAEQIWWQHLRAREWSGIGRVFSWFKVVQSQPVLPGPSYLPKNVSTKNHTFPMTLQNDVLNPGPLLNQHPRKACKAWGPGLEGPVVGGTLVSHQKCIRLARK